MRSFRRLFPCTALLLAMAACGDSEPADDDGPEPATFQEPLVESSAIEGLGILHSRPEQEVFYEAGVFPQYHPIAIIIQMAWDADGYDHPIYVGLVNQDRTRGCLIGSRNIAYGGPGTVEEDEQARRFVIQSHIPDHCGAGELGDGPYDVWIGANRLIGANPAFDETDESAPEGEAAYAFLDEGNVLIFGADGVTDLSGAGRVSTCGKIVPGDTAFERTTDACGDRITVTDSPGSNILIDKMELDSSVAVLTTAEIDGTLRCVQEKGTALIQGNLDLALYGQQPEGFETDDVVDELDGEIKVIQRLCPSDSGRLDETACDDSELPWINLLVNPQERSERTAWNEEVIKQRFPGASDSPEPIDADALENGGFNDVVEEMGYLDLRAVPQQAMLPRQACQPVLTGLEQDRTTYVLESCVRPGGEATAQDTAFGGERDNCIRTLVEVTTEQINVDPDPTGPPPPPPAPLPGAPVANDDGHRGGWLSFMNRNGLWITSYGDSDWTKLQFIVGYTVAGGTDGAYAGAYFEANLDGEYDFALAGLEIYADAHDSSNDDGSEAVFEATVFGASEGVGSSAASAFELRVSAFGGGFEKCVDEKIGWWVVSIKVEGCASFFADVGGTLTGEFYLSNDDGNLEALVGIMDVGPLVEAYMDGSVQVGDGCCSISLSGALDPLAYLSLGNDYYLVGEVTTGGDLVGITIGANLWDLLVELIDGYVKLKVKFLGTSKSTKLINASGFNFGFTLFGFSITLD